MSVAYASNTCVKLDAQKISHLVTYGMRLFDEAGIYVSPSKMSKLVRESARKHGYALTEMIVRQYFKNAELLEWESYKRVLRGSDV